MSESKTGVINFTIDPNAMFGFDNIPFIDPEMLEGLVEGVKDGEAINEFVNMIIDVTPDALIDTDVSLTRVSRKVTARLSALLDKDAVKDDLSVKGSDAIYQLIEERLAGKGDSEYYDVGMETIFVATIFIEFALGVVMQFKKQLREQAINYGVSVKDFKATLGDNNAITVSLSYTGTKAGLPIPTEVKTKMAGVVDAVAGKPNSEEDAVATAVIKAILSVGVVVINSELEKEALRKKRQQESNQKLLDKLVVDDAFIGFYGEADIASNFFAAKYAMYGRFFPTVEHGFQYEKAKFFNDQVAMAKILEAKSPGEAKKIGREVTGYFDPVWKSARGEKMRQHVEAKYRQNPRLARLLIELRKRKNANPRFFIEGSKSDKVWGCGIAKEDLVAQRGTILSEGAPGENKLGRITSAVLDIIEIDTLK